MFTFYLSFILALSGLAFNPTSQLNESEARLVLLAAGWDLAVHDQAIDVLYCESSGFPARVGDGGNSLGLFQIQWTPTTWPGWRHAPGFESFHNVNLVNPIDNALIARLIYEQHGWEPWTCKPKNR